MNLKNLFNKLLIFFCVKNIILSLIMSENYKDSFCLYTKNNNIDNQYIISSKNNNIYCNNDAQLYLKKNEFINNKKLITISPGGFKGFYLFGINTFIKENYDLNNFIYSGASAGAWNGLFMCYKNDPFEFVYNLLDYNIKKSKTISELEFYMKYKILSCYKEEDFDLRRLFIGVTSFTNFKSRTNIFSDFSNLDDAINCCIASSHIPFVSGGFTNKYQNMYTFDGGFSNYPYLNIENQVLHISPNMWNELNIKKNFKNSINSVQKYIDIFSISKNNLLELFDDGYQDAKKNKNLLDKFLL